MSPGGRPFGVTIGFDAAQVLVGINGEIDGANAPEVGGLLDAIIAAGHTIVVLDLAELDLMNGSGLRVIADRSDRLRQAGGALSIRSPSSAVRRILDVTGVGRSLEIEPSTSLHCLVKRSHCAGHGPALDVAAASRRAKPAHP